MATALAGRKLIRKDGLAAPASALHGKVVALYFSASWCPPCHQFTPILADFYRQVKAAGGNLEIVYVPGDKSAPEMMQYFQEHADYLALDMSEAGFVNQLNQRYQVRGIPSVVVIQPDGTPIDADARATLQARGVGAFAQWKAAWKGGSTVKVHGLKAAAQFNGEVATVLSFDAVKGRFILLLETGAHLAARPMNVVIETLGHGAAVEVGGLVGAAQHNGKRGRIVGGPDPGNGRYAVTLDGEGGATLGLKLSNLELVECADARRTSDAAAGEAAGAPEPAPSS